MNKRQSKKRLSKQSYIISIDLSTQPDMTAYIPASLLHHIYADIKNELDNTDFYEKSRTRYITWYKHEGAKRNDEGGI